MTVSDPIPTGATYVSGSGSGWSCSNSGGVVTCSRSAATATGSIPNLTLAFRPTNTGTITNAVSISATESDPDSSDNSATANNTVIAGADAQITQTATASPIATGSPLNYVLTVRNNGPGAASGFTVTDTLSPNVTFSSASGSGWSCSQSSNTVTCTTSGPLASGSTLPTIAISTTAANAGTATNTATVATTSTDPTSSNNTSSLNSTIQTAGADMSISESASPNPVANGQNVTFTITGKNNGPLATSGTITITDPLPSGLNFVSATGSGWTCSNASGTVTCTYSGTVASGVTMSSVSLTANVATAGSFNNQPCIAVASPTDPVSGNNCVTSGGSVSSTSTQADLVVTQDAPTPNPVLGGSVLTYTIHVANNGPDDAGSVTMTDSLYSSTNVSITPSQGTCNNSNPYLSCSLGTITNGSSATITVQIKPTVSGTRTNTAVASSGTVGDPNTGNNSSTVSSTVTPSADMTLTQVATPEPVLAGTNLTYVLTARNNAGTSTATGVTVTDTLPSSVTFVSASASSGSCSPSGQTVTCNIGSLSTGSQGTVTIVVTPNTPGSIVASGTVTSALADPDNTNNSANATSTVNPAQVDVQVTKYGTPNPVAYGSNVTYTVTVHNSGPSIATGVVATDTPMTQFTLVSTTPSQGTCSGTAPVTCNLGTIANNASATMTMVMTASTMGTFDNQVSVTSNETDTNTANNSTDEQTTSRQGADLSITKSASASSIPKNGTENYTIVVSNAGPVAEATTTVTDTLPAGLTFVSSSATQGSCSGTTTVTCNLGALAPSASATVTITVSPTSTGTIVNTVSATGSEPDPNSANNTASASITVTPVADLTISKTHSGNFTAGQAGTYSITATNSGDAATTAAVWVSDTLPAGLTYASASGTGWTCSAAGQTVSCTRSDALGAAASYPAITLAVNVAAAAPNSIVNTATVSGGGEVVISNDTASDTATVTHVPDLTVTKTHTGSFSQGQSNALYTLTVSNAGTASSAGTVTLSDAVPAGLTPVTATGTGWSCSIAGQSVTCTRPDAVAAGASFPVVTVAVSVASNAAASLTNTATVSGGGDTNSANNSASDVTAITATPDLTLTKTNSGPIPQGGSGSFSLTVTNAGSAATSATMTVTDTFPAGLTPAAGTGAGWSCSVAGQTVTCTSSSAVAPAGNAAAITIPVTVSTTAPASITNTATVSGGGEVNTANDTATSVLAVTQVPDLTIALSHGGSFAQGSTTATYSLQASNAGGAASSGTVTINDTLPAGLTPVSAAGTGWACSPPAGQLVTCTRADALAANAAFPPIALSVNVAPNAPLSLTNTATVSGGSETNTANDSASDTVAIAGTPDLTLSMTNSGGFSQGGSGSFTLTASNAGGAASSGTATVVDTFPAGVTPGSATGAGWSCSTATQTVTCTRSDSVLAAGQYPAIQVPVTLTNSAPLSFTNTATVSGGAEVNTANDTATNVVSGAAGPDLAITLTASSGSVQGQTATFTIGNSNVGGATTRGGVTVTDTFPAGLTPVTATGSLWTCSVAAPTVSCTRSDVLAPGAAYPAITVTTNVAGTAAASLSDTATIAGGGDVNLTNNSATTALAVTPASDLTVSLAHSAGFAQGGAGTYTVTVNNIGGAPTAGVISFTATLPSGVTATAPSGSGWTCTVNGQILDCSRTTVLTAGSSFPPLSVPVAIAANSPLVLNAQAIVSGGGEINTANDTASDAVNVTAQPDLTLAKSHTGNFTAASPGAYSLTVSNGGGAPTSAAVSVTDSIPAGLTPTSATGTGWSCAIAGQVVTCTRSDALAPAASYPPIHIAITLTGSLSGTVTNTATVSGGGETNTANDQASDTAVITSVPDLTIVKSHTGTLVRGLNATYTLAVSNSGTAATDGTLIQMVDVLPSGLIPQAASGTGWSCTVAGQTVTCTRSDKIAPQTAAPAITLMALVTSSAPASITNTVTISGGGDMSPANNQASDTAATAAKPDLKISLAQSPAFHKASLANYWINVSNVGAAPTDGSTITVADTLPTGLTPVSATGPNWGCGMAGQLVTCTRADVLAPGTAYPPITLAVNVSSTVNATLLNSASVSGSGDPNMANNSAAQTLTVQPAVYSDMTVALSHTGDFTQGATGQYSIVASNAGAGPTDGVVTLSDPLPAGLTPARATGDGWTCSLSQSALNCTRADVLAPGAQYPAIALVVNVSPTSPLALVNTATVGGGAEINLANDTASDPTRIVLPPMPQLGITAAVDRSTAEMGDVLTYTLQVSDNAAVPAENSTVNSLLPSSFVYVPGTTRIQAGAASATAGEPRVTGSNLAFSLGHIPAHGLFVIRFRARIGANVRPGTHVDASDVAGYAPTGQHVGPVSASVPVKVGASMLTAQRALVGRVFVDANGNSAFDKGDIPVPGARVFLSDGQAAVTDSEGLYSLPTIPPGSVVATMDPITMPEGYVLSSEGERAGHSLARLLRTPLGGGTVVRQNFALLPVPNVAHASLLPGDRLHSLAFAAAPPPIAKKEKLPEPTGSVAPGDVLLVSPLPNEPVTDSSPELVARVAEKWSAAFELNGHRLPNTGLVSAIHQPTKTVTLTLPGVSIAPGPNKLRVIAIGPDGASGRSVEVSFHRSGPAKQIEVVAAKGDLTAGGNDSTAVTVRALDAWQQPAQDGSVDISTSRGEFRSLQARAGQAHAGQANAGQDRPAQTALPSPAALDFQSLGSTLSTNFTGLDTGAVQQRPVTQNPSGGSTLSRAIDGVNSSPDSSNPVPGPVPGTAVSGAAAPMGSLGSTLAAGSALSAHAPTAPEENGQQQTLELRGGSATAWLRSSEQTGSAQIVAASGDSAAKVEGRASVAMVPELRSPILAGVGELSFGSAAPEMTLFNNSGDFERRTQFFYSGRLLSSNLLTLAYSSNSPLNRTSGYDQMFNMDATNQQYVVFGDSSARFYYAQSNSHLYARIDHRLSYIMFGDLSGNLQRQQTDSLTNFDRSITGLKVHLEDRRGNSLSVTGARPETAYARDVFPGNALGLIALSHQAVLPGSEVVTLETRDRRNPGVIVSRETLIRSTDYTMDNLNGSIFFLRSISPFDSSLNLTQVLIDYEYQAIGLSSSVYTARAEKRFDQAGLRLGFSALSDRQGGADNYLLAGVEASKVLPHHGVLSVEAPVSRGNFVTTGTAFTDTSNGSHNGVAVRADLEQPIATRNGMVRASFSKTDANFLNPFGSTIVPGAETLNGSYEFKPLHASSLRLGFTGERNRTANVDNHRYTFSGAWKQELTERIDLVAGFDHRDFDDNLVRNIIDSNLLTVGADWRATSKLQASIRREQNLTAADPTYPTQTVLSAKYQISPVTRLFYTQRLSSAPIIPIGDLSAAGFASTNTTTDMALGIETRIRPSTSLQSRYEIDNGVNGVDSYAVLGVIDRLHLNERTGLDFGAERGVHIDGKGHDFDSGTVAASWRPNKLFRATGRYELRDQFGFASLITAGGAGRIASGVTALGQVQFVRGQLNGQNTNINRAIASLAIRPLKSEKAGLLFSYSAQSGTGYTLLTTNSTPVRVNILSTDGWWNPYKRLELYSRLASSDRTTLSPDEPNLSTGTYLWQQRIQYRFAHYFDGAGEARWLWQPVTSTDRRTAAFELGGWLLPDIRLGIGYSLDSIPEIAPNFLTSPVHQGVYFNITGKFSRLFDLFGTQSSELSPKK